MRTWVRTVVALLVLAVVLAACAGGGDDRTAGDSAADTSAAGDFSAGSGEADEGEAATTGVDTASLRAAAGGGAQTAGDDSGGAAPRPDVGPAEARVVRTATLRLEVAAGGFAQAVQEATSLATALGGFVASSETSSFEEGRGSADLTIRVPVARFDDAIGRLSELGELKSQSLEGKDVTGELVDLDARLRTLRAEEEALNAILAGAGNVGDLLAVRSQITGLRQQIEQLAAQQASLADRADYSTIHASLREPRAAAPPDDPEPDDAWGLAKALRTAIDAAEAVVGGFVVLLGFLTPLVLLGVPAWLLWRRYGRREAVQPG